MKRYLYAVLMLFASGYLLAQPLVIDSLQISPIDCNGLCSGQLDVFASGTSGPLTYSVDGGSTYLSFSSFSALCPGTYNVWVQDAGLGLFADTTVVIVEPAPLGITNASTTNVTCIGACDGSLSISPYGGTTSANGYLVQWSNEIPGDSILSDLCSGTYVCLISDDNGCVSDSIALIISEPSEISFTVDVQNVSCNGANDGSIIFTASGGSGIYQYSSDEGGSWQSSNTFTGVPVGLWGIIVRDDLLCQNSSSITITEPPVLSADAGMDVTVCATEVLVLNGSAIGGVPGYVYTWDNGVTDGVPFNATVSTSYTLTAADANGCMGTDVVLATVTPAINANAGIDQTICEAAGTVNLAGSITTATGGLWSTSGTGTFLPNNTTLNASYIPSANDILAGFVTLTLTTTGNGACVPAADDCAVTINATSSGITVSSTATNILCNGNCDAQLSADATGGVGPYTYVWSNGMSGGSITGVCAGTHSVFVADANGCEGNDVVTVSEPVAMSNTLSTVAPACGLNNGSAEVTATSGGASPYAYQWSNGSVTALADSVAAGVYTVAVTDANGCYLAETVNITSSTSPSVTSSLTSPACNGGNDASIDLTISGGTAPFTFDWSTGAQTEDISSLPAGIYDVTIMDASGCGIVQVFTLSDALPIDLSAVAITDALCGSADGVITVLATGGAGGYNYLWSTGGTNAVEGSLSAGTYTLSVSDASGCLAMANYSVSNASGPVIIVDQVNQPTCQGGSGEIFVSVSGGVAPYSYSWSNGATSEDLVNAAVGNYELIVSDAIGCQGVEYAELLGVNLNAAEICMVTVDTTTGANLVVWTKEYNLGISGYEIYKETSVVNIFQLLGTVPFDSLTQFVDTAANSSIHSYRYKLRTLDSCSNASEFLAYHKTIHLASNIGLSSVINLSWDDYIGFSYSTFYINRYHPSVGWEVIDSVAANVHSYTDNTYPSLVGLEYGIEVVPASPCSAEKAQDHNTTRSNRASIADPNSGPNAINENPVIDFILFPNPTEGKFTLSFSGELSEVNVKVFDVQGKLITSFYMGNASGAKEFDISNYEKGIYLMKINLGDSLIYKKIIKQ